MPDHSVQLASASLDALPIAENLDGVSWLMASTTLSARIVSATTASGVCIVVGPPRTGKSTAMIRAARELEKRKCIPPGTRYLDLIRVRDPIEDIRACPWTMIAENGVLLLIDNWHARPDCHLEVARALRTRPGHGWHLVIASTEFASQESEEDSDSEGLDLESDVSELLDGQGGRQIATVVDSGSTVGDIATSMVRHRVLLAGRPTGEDVVAEIPFEPVDAERMLNIEYGSHLKLRSNLRFLARKLEVWKVFAEPLSQVSLNRVMAKRHEMWGNLDAHDIAMLEQLAAVCQFEVPFRRELGQSIPAALTSLCHHGAVVEIEKNRQWRMDSTDAYLLLHRPDAEKWTQDVFALLEKYLADHLYQATDVVNSVARMAAGHSALLERLLQSDPICTAVNDWYLLALANNPKLLASLATLLSKLYMGSDRADAASRRPVDLLASRVTRGLGRLIAEGTMTLRPQQLYWLVRDLSAQPELLRDICAAADTQQLAAHISAMPLRRMQRRIIAYIRDVAPETAGSLEERVVFKPGLARPSLSEAHTVPLLFNRAVAIGVGRQYARDVLRRLDDRWLIRLFQEEDAPFYRLRTLLDAATWLDSREARRIVGWLGNIDPVLLQSTRSFKSLWFVLDLCKYLDPDATRRLASQLVQLDLIRVLGTMPQEQWGFLLAKLDAAASGVADVWCRKLAREVIPAGSMTCDERGLWPVIGVALARSDTLLAAILSSRLASGLHPSVQAVLHRLLAHEADENSSHAAGAAPDAAGLPELLGTLSTIPFLIHLYAWAEAGHTAAKMNRLPSILQARSRASLIALGHVHAGRLGSLRDAVCRVLAGFDIRRRWLRHVVACFCGVQQLNWPRRDFNRNNVIHRALSAAIDEGLLRQSTPWGDGWAPNFFDDFVAGTTAQCGELLEPIRDRRLALNVWDARLGGAGIEDCDGLRMSLMDCGLVVAHPAFRADGSLVEYGDEKPSSEVRLAALGLVQN